MGSAAPEGGISRPRAQRVRKRVCSRALVAKALAGGRLRGGRRRGAGGSRVADESDAAVRTGAPTAFHDCQRGRASMNKLLLFSFLCAGMLPAQTTLSPTFKLDNGATVLYQTFSQVDLNDPA